MALLTGLEKPLEDINKQLPKLPKGFKDFLVQVVPWLALIGAALSLWAAWGIWQWARWIGSWATAFGVTSASRWGTMIYLSLAALIIAVIIYALAFSPLREYKKKGWDLLFLGVIVNLVYGILVAFSVYGGFGDFFSYLIGTAIGLYVLFQTRDYYTGKEKVAAANKIGSQNNTATDKKDDNDSKK